MRPVMRWSLYAYLLMVSAAVWLLLLLSALMLLLWNGPMVQESSIDGSYQHPAAPSGRRDDKNVPEQISADRKLSDDFGSDLVDLRKVLTDMMRKTRSTHTRHQLQGSINRVQQMMYKLLLEVETESNDKTDDRTIPSLKVISKDVCPENFTSRDLSGGYPFFYQGHDMQNCTDVPVFSDILTLVFNTVQYQQNDEQLIQLINNIHSIYPKIPIIMAVNLTNYQSIRARLKEHQQPIHLIQFIKSAADTDVWNSLVKKVETRYVFLARDVVHFTWHSRLERLVRELGDLNAEVVAGSYRLMSGQWSYGCVQSSLQNYTLVYTKGYDWSIHECMVCDSVQGPVALRTDTIKQNKLPAKMNDISGFEVWFLKMKESQSLMVSCPDSMFFSDRKVEEDKKLWLDLARNLQVEVVKLPSNTEHYFTCSEANVDCAKTKGRALSHCCLRKLSQLMKTFLVMCKEAGCLCELQEGSLLGAVKFNGLLPWERDADITFHSSNFSKIKEFEPKLQALGYILNTISEPWCCVDGVKAGGVFTLQTGDWTLELYGQHVMDSEKLLLQNIAPTLIEVDGMIVPAPTSPGLFSRNRYGHEIYQHAQHWFTSSKQKSGWAFYQPGTFTECHETGKHYCLDQYLADGNLQFRSVNP